MNLEEYSAYLKSIAEQADKPRKTVVKTTKKIATKQNKLQPKNFTKIKRIP